MHKARTLVKRKRMFQAEPALVYDSVQVFAHGLAALDRSHDLRPANLSCEKEEPWDDGLSLYNYINAVRTFCEFLSELLDGIVQIGNNASSRCDYVYFGMACQLLF